ncbi:unnamed protein product [Macrosiphum euphorbiae]|uniref:Uncharacterized protein n=1 Tax=Macrosiphum euphorbiae TaxID=13131 RepID=A0AAV0WUG1_9HEMI|nr:unnamed protein product [Macrosiphum euphorbiae]
MQTFIYEIITKHIKQFHSFENIIEYKCIEPSFIRSYNSFDSFSRHLLNHTVVNQEFSNNLHIEPMQIVGNLHENTNEEPVIIPCSEISIQEFKDLVTKDAIILV